MSIDDKKLGGYCKWFDESICTDLAEGYSFELDDFKAWAKDVMTLRAFKQIRSAFHPDPGFTRDMDKCYQLRYIINKFNDTAMHTFIPGIDMSFDKEGIPLRSRMNSVWQYNKDNPNNYRVNFFYVWMTPKEIFCPTHRFISRSKCREHQHSRLYLQTSNSSEGKFFISSYWCEYSIWNIYTNALTMSCMKAVLNADLQSGISNYTKGMWCLHIDNHYSAGTLFIILHEVHGILAFGTVHVNRVGWPHESINLSVKTNDNGASKCL